MLVFLFTWDRLKNYHLSLHPRKSSLAPYSLQWGKRAKIKERTWFIGNPQLFGGEERDSCLLPTSQPSSSGRACLPLCFRVVGQRETASQLPSTWPAADVLVVAKCAWHGLWSGNPVTGPTCQIKPTLPWAAEQPGCERLQPWPLSPALPASNICSLGSAFSPGSFQMQPAPAVQANPASLS